VLEEIARRGGVTVMALLQGPVEGRALRAFPSALIELGVSEVLAELTAFLEGGALVINRLPRRYRNQYKERIRESLSKLERDLMEYQALLEVTNEKRRGRPRGNRPHRDPLRRGR
jgi:hypothetical protein